MPIQMLQDNNLPQRALDLGQRGTAFPANPLTNDRFWRSDRGFWYYYDGTRWLSEVEYNMPLAFLPSSSRPITVTTAAVLFSAGPESSSTLSIYVTTLAHFWFIQATFNSTNFWSGQLYTQDATNPKATLGPSFSAWSTGRLASVKYIDPITINTVITQPNFLQCQIDYTTTGAPGNLFWDPCILKYRLVG